MIEEDFPDNKEHLMKSLSREGYSMPGEPLSINIYPFFFEEWVLDLMKKTKPAVSIMPIFVIYSLQKIIKS